MADQLLVPVLEHLKNFGNLLLTLTSNNVDYSPKFALTNFIKSPINLMTDLPGTGTFLASSPVTTDPIFVSGTYTVTNCIIDGDDIIEQQYVWNCVDSRVTCPLEIVTLDLSDNTACDYYYVPEDWYTPVSIAPNPQLTESNITVKYPVLYSAINYFNMIENQVSTSKFALFYIVQSSTNPEVCVLKTFYLNSIEFPAGLSLSYLTALPNRTSIQNYQFLVLNYVYNLSGRIVSGKTVQNHANLGGVAANGFTGVTSFDGTDVAVSVYKAKFLEGQATGIGSLNNNGDLELLLVLGSATSGSPFNNNFVPSSI